MNGAQSSTRFRRLLSPMFERILIQRSKHNPCLFFSHLDDIQGVKPGPIVNERVYDGLVVCVQKVPSEGSWCRARTSEHAV